MAVLWQSKLGRVPLLSFNHEGRGRSQKLQIELAHEEGLLILRQSEVDLVLVGVVHYN